MSCKFKAPNGKKSELYDELFKTGANTALKNWAMTRTPEFKAWFGNGQVDMNGEPTINEIGEYTNEVGETQQVIYAQVASEAGSITLEAMAEQIEQLTAIFENAGLDIDVALNSDMLAAGSVVTINGKTTVELNPNKIKADTIFHEFGHLLVDMYDDQAMIERGIESLKGTAFAEKLRRLYPNLSEEAFGKELITTAIGIEAAAQNNYIIKARHEAGKSMLGKVKAWKFWVGHFFKTLAKKLSIGETAIKTLAYELTNNKLEHRLTGKPVDMKMFHRTTPTLSVEEIVKRSSRASTSADENAYILDGDESGIRMTRTTNAIEDFKGIFNTDKAVAAVAKKYKMTEDEVRELWADKREEGTGIHLIAEIYIDAINSGVSRKEAIKLVLDNLFKPDKAGELDDAGVRYYQGMDRSLVEGYIDNFADFIDGLFAKGYKLYPEVKLFDEELGLAGTIDLLIETPEGDLMIYDWKTKEDGKFDEFYSQSSHNPYFLDLMSDVARSKAAEYSLQLSVYQLMLERLGHKVTKLAIVPIVGDMIMDTEGENRYVNLRLHEDVFTDKDGVLPLDPLTDKLRTILYEKNDIEEMLEEIEETEVSLERMAAQVKELHKTNKWIEETVLNLTKSVSRMRATATVDKAEQYEKAVKKVIKQLMIADEVKAITAYTAYVSNAIAGMYRKLQTRVIETKDSEGNPSQIMKKGYSHFTWVDIKNLEESDPKGYMEFLAFLINADTFLQQLMRIQELPSTGVFKDDSDLNLIIKSLKANEGDVTDLKQKIKTLNKELDMRYNELSSNPLYGGRGVLQGTEDFFKAQSDESFFQRNMDAMADTHNSYIANVIRMYDYKMRKFKDENLSMQQEWDTQVKKLESSGSNLARLVDEAFGRVVPEIDNYKYYEARSKAYEEATTKYPSKGKGWNAIMNKWFNENTEPLTNSEVTKLQALKKRQLSNKEYKQWHAKQVYSKGGKNFYKKQGAYHKPRTTVWAHATYKSFTAAEREFHAYLVSSLAYLVEHNKNSIVHNGFLPAIPKNEASTAKQMIANLGWRDAGDYNSELGVIVNENGELVHFLPFKYNNMLNQEPYEEITEGLSEEAKRAIKDRNKEKKKQNSLAHAGSVNMDLQKTMKVFIHEALKNKHKKAMEFELIRVKKSFVENHKILVQKDGKPIVDKMKKMAGLENNTVEKSTIGSNTLKHYEDWLKMVFYEEFEADEGTWQKVARVLQNYTSFKGMAMNVLSAINNQTYGGIMSGIEAAAGQFFNGNDWKDAAVEYSKGLTSYFRDGDEDNASSKQSAFIHYFNISMDFTERAAFDNQNIALANRALRASSWVFSKAYAMEHMSEHNLQNRVLFAMAKSHKVVNGAIVSFEQYKQGRLKKVDYRGDAAENKANMAENKATMALLKEEWKGFTNVIDSFDFKDGKISKRDDVQLNPNEYAEFERRVLGVNQYLHGIYNKEDAGAIQHYALGRLAIQFRKWMRPGWNKRWGTRFGQSFWNERRSAKDEGIYITTMKYFGSPIIDAVKQYSDTAGTDEAVGVVQSIGNIIKGYGRFVANSKVHWHTLDSSERANVIRTIGEYITFCTVIGALYLFKHIKGEDDEPPLALMLMIYQLDRTAVELTTYVPLAAAPGYVGGGWLNESKKILKSPAATFNTMESAIRIGEQLIMFPFAEEKDLTYQSGVYHGQNKLMTQIEKAIPLYNQVGRLQNLYKNYHYYKLF